MFAFIWQCVTIEGWMLKFTSFGRASFSYSAVQPCFDIKSPGQMATCNIRVSLGKLFDSRFCVQPTYGIQEYQTSIDTAQFTPWLSGVLEINFFVPREIHLIPE